MIVSLGQHSLPHCHQCQNHVRDNHDHGHIEASAWITVIMKYPLTLGQPDHEHPLSHDDGNDYNDDDDEDDDDDDDNVGDDDVNGLIRMIKIFPFCL